MSFRLERERGGFCKVYYRDDPAKTDKEQA